MFQQRLPQLKTLLNMEVCHSCNLIREHFVIFKQIRQKKRTDQIEKGSYLFISVGQGFIAD